MMARIRPIYEMITLPLGRVSARLGLTPDFWTWVSLGAAVFAAKSFADGGLLFGFVLMLVMNVCDMLDGATARARGGGSRFGSVLDHVVDRYAEFILVGGLLLGGHVSSLAGLFAASGMVMASYVRAKAESVGGLEECTVGIAGRQEKLTLMMLGIVLQVLLGWPAIEWTMWLIGIISHLTAAQRLLYTRAQLWTPPQTPAGEEPLAG